MEIKDVKIANEGRGAGPCRNEDPRRILYTCVRYLGQLWLRRGRLSTMRCKSHLLVGNKLSLLLLLQAFQSSSP